MTLLLQLLINGLVTGALYALVALGFGLVYRSTRVFHLALGAIYTAAAYGVYITLRWGREAGIIIGILTALILGLLIERFVYRPLYKRSSSSGVILVASLGIYIFVVNLIALVFGNEVKILSRGIEPSVTFFGIILTRMQLIQFFTGVFVIFIWVILLKKLRFFKGIWAMGDEPVLVRVLGLPLWRFRDTVFLLSSFLVAVSSILVALDVGVDPHIGLPAFLIGAVAVLVGGVSNFRGWVISAFIIAELQSLVIWKFSARWNDAITFVVLIIVLLLRPQGIFSVKGRMEER